MDTAKLEIMSIGIWETRSFPSLTEYMRIPNKSPAFDPEWEKHGYMRDAVALMERWAREKIAPLKGATLEVVQLPGRTPVIFIDIPGRTKRHDPAAYGHLDKQPEMVGWADGTARGHLCCTTTKFFGRGGADDGYAMFAALSAIGALHEQGVAHARCVVLIEACEESGSYDLPFYVDQLAAPNRRTVARHCLIPVAAIMSACG